MVEWGFREPEVTIHFNVGKLTGASTATPGTADPEAMAIFGQLNIQKSLTITALHQHLIEDGSTGTSTFEIYRRRDGVFTLLGVLSIAQGGGDNAFASVVPAGDLQFLLRGDYLFAQATSLMTGGDGLTLDVHFDGLQS